MPNPTSLSPKPATYYQIHLDLNPHTHFLNVDLSLEMEAPFPGVTELIFYLHRQFKIDRIQCQNVAGFAFVPTPTGVPYFMPDSGILFIRLNEACKQNEQLHLNISYSGNITRFSSKSANVVGPNWVELGLFMPWFPYNPDYGLFSYKVEVSCPSEYRVVGAGKVTHAVKNHVIENDRPSNDIVIAAGGGIESREFREKECIVIMHSSSLSQETVNQMAGELVCAMKQFEVWYGGERCQDIALIESPRKNGGGYTRPGIIVLTELSDEGYTSRPESYLRYLAHEASHLWWSSANVHSWENWLNESFAEYSALLIVRKRYGETSFLNRLAEKAKASQGTDPIWGFSRTAAGSNGEAENILYGKGPVLLNALSNQIGEEKFLSICQTMVAERVSNTLDWLDIVARTAGKDIARWVEDQLKTSENVGTTTSGS
jgi:hypothetical protein